MTGPAVARHAPLTRLLHWATAALVFTALLVGFAMVNTLGDYATLLTLHRTVGALVLVIVIARLANRFVSRAPRLPATVGRAERVLVVASEIGLYLLLLAQPLVGWAMVSASGAPVIVFGGLRLIGIAPVSTELYAALRSTHEVLAYALVVLIAAHVSAVLLHSMVLRDQMLARMTLGR